MEGSRSTTSSTHIRLSGRLSIVGEDEALALPPPAAVSAHDDTEADDSDETDLEIDSPSTKARDKNIYLSACRLFDVAPTSYFLRWENSDSLRIKHHDLGLNGVKAMCVALVSNTTIEVLDLEDNGIDMQGSFYIADMLRENYFISDLNLANNRIGAQGAIALFSVIAKSDSLTRLDVSRNNIGDAAATAICESFLENRRITDLNICGNGFGDRGGRELARMLLGNTRLLKLNVSENHIRGEAASIFLSGVRRNHGLQHLNISNNGIGMEACAELSKLIKDNRVIEEIEVSNNRVPQAGCLLLAKALKTNTTLKFLDLSRNSFLAPGCMVILEALSKNNNSALRFISFGTTMVSQQFTEMQETIEREKHLLVQHGGVTEGWRYKSTVPTEHLRGALCFLTDEECWQLAKCLERETGNSKKKTTLIILGRVTKKCGWVRSHTEIVKRASKAVIHGQIDYSSLLTR